MVIIRKISYIYFKIPMMKNFYIAVFACFAIGLNAQTINFPDANLKIRLLQGNTAYDRFSEPMTLDTNNNGSIEVEEVQDVESLNISNSSISDLTGISNFTNLKFLNCSNNSLPNITIDSALSLMVLKADHNQITSIDVNYANLEELDLSFNNLTSFSVANANFYETLNLENNQLSSLSLDNVMVQYFRIGNNNLSSIQYNGNVTFYGFANFSNNQFSLLRFPTNVFFDNSCDLVLGGNTVDAVYFDYWQPGNISYRSVTNTSFDLGNFSMSKSCDPEEQGNVNIQSSPNLQQVIFKNGFNHTTITCNEGWGDFQNPALRLTIGNCPNLSQICVDNDEQPFFQARIDQLGLQNQVSVNSNCTSSVLDVETPDIAEPFTIFPVPVQNILQLQSNINHQVRSVEIYNNLGQLVLRETGDRQSIDVSRLAKGSYYLEIKTDDLIAVKQFLKN